MVVCRKESEDIEALGDPRRFPFCGVWLTRHDDANLARYQSGYQPEGISGHLSEPKPL
jgi:hypothetical protein